MGSYQNEEAVGFTEDDMLDELEGSTLRMFQQSKALNEEAATQLRLLNKIDGEMGVSSSDLRTEARHAESARKAKSGTCWMYCVIIVELIFLISLIIKGLKI